MVAVAPITKETFLAQYTNPAIYRPELRGHLGVELELWLQDDSNGRPTFIPFVHELLPVLRQDDRFRHRVDPEFSGAQLEVRTDPCATPEQVVDETISVSRFAQRAAQEFGWRLVANPYVDDPAVPQVTSPLVPRYAEYALEHPHRAPHMFRVAAWQIHIGTKSFEEACVVYNRMVDHLELFVVQGWLDPRRRKAFRTICPGWFPPRYDSPGDLWHHAQARGFVHSPKLNYAAVRIHPKWGTVELRLPDATLDPEVMLARARRVREIADM